MYKRHLKNWIFQYKDPKKKFLSRVMKKVFYLNSDDLTKDNRHDIFYRLVPQTYEQGQLIMKENSNANSLMFVECGLIEVYTEFEGNEFVIEKLYSGSVINFRAFFMEDLNYVNMRAVELTRILELNHNTMEKIKNDNANFNKKVTLY